MPDPIVQVEGLTFRYRRGTEPAIRDLSLRIEPGEIVLVAGPTASGNCTINPASIGLVPHASARD